MTTTNTLSKKMMFFYAVELISAIAYTITEGFLGLIWFAVAISFIGLIPKLTASKFPAKTITLIARACLLLSSITWGYIIMYYLSSTPVILTTILVARVIATLITFKELRDHIIIVAPLLIGFALLKQAGCIPPIAF